MILSTETQIETIEHHFKAIMETLGLDLSDPSIATTPKRVAKMYVEELCSGLNPDNFPTPTFITEGFTPGEMIEIQNITVSSLCEHHFLPFFGTANISYIPTTKILGLSKFNRIVDYFCRRPQLQERLTKQIVETLSLLLETEDISVTIRARHLCVSLRGARDTASETITVVRRGVFEERRR
jgi:GTP cyclohydrolase I